MCFNKQVKTHRYQGLHLYMTNFGKMLLIRYELPEMMFINFCYSVNLIGCKDKCINIGYSGQFFFSD